MATAMPRPAWIAAGSVVAALATTAGPLSAGLLLAGIAFSVTLALIGAHQQKFGAAAACAAAALVLGRAMLVALIVAPAPSVDASTVNIPAGWNHEAVVVSVNAPAAGTQRAIVELRPPDAEIRVWATLPRYPAVVPGDSIRFGGTLEPAPQGTGFGEYLARSGIAWTTRARELERLGGDGSPVAELEQLRRGAASAISAALPEPGAGLAAAMSIGLRDLVARDVAADFRTTGLSHVVAISGWHIAMLGAVVAGLLSRLSRRTRSVVVLAAIGAYAVFAGASPSILRATVMAAVVLLARESGRRGSAAAGFSLTVAGMLLLEPATIGDIGFQLSAAATAGLLLWGTGVRVLLEKRLPRRTPGWLLETLGVSLAAQAATLPLVLFHFGTLSVVSPFANVLVAPLVAPAMLITGVCLGCGLVIGAGVPALLFAPVSLVGALIVGTMIAIADVCAALPFASVVLDEPLNLAAAAAFAGLLVPFLRRVPGRSEPSRAAASERRYRHSTGSSARRSPRVVLTGAGAALAILLVAATGGRPDGRLHVTVLDVGQGDSILLQGPNGGRALIDTGPDPDRLVTLLDARIPAWDRRLDLVVLTHPHEDHVAGVAAILDRYRVGEIVEPGMVGPGPGDAAYRQRLTELGRESRVVAAGDQLVLDGVKMNVEWPLRGTVPLRAPNTGTAINNVSIVLDIQFGARRFLLAGDVEEEIDPQLLAAGIGRDGRTLDVLKVAHHGSATATTDAFVEQIKPRIAVVSAGWGNPYGHPSPATVARLRARGASVFRTDLDGSVDISTDGTDLLSRASGGRPRTPARSPTPLPAAGLGFCPVPQPALGASGDGWPRTYNRADVDPQSDRGGTDPAPIGAAGLAA